MSTGTGLEHFKFNLGILFFNLNILAYCYLCFMKGLSSAVQVGWHCLGVAGGTWEAAMQQPGSAGSSLLGAPRSCSLLPE